jgi:hypothetical protein
MLVNKLQRFSEKKTSENVLEDTAKFEIFLPKVDYIGDRQALFFTEKLL